MKTIPVSLIVAGIMAPITTMAGPFGQAPENNEEARRGPNPFMESWKKADSNSDGAISKDEFAAMPRIQNLPAEKRTILFERLDKNADGKLDRQELMRASKHHDGQGPPMQQRLWELDTDKSGGVSFEEMKAGQLFQKLEPDRQAAVFKRLDTNGDGVITPKDKPEPPFKRDGEKMRPQRPEGGKGEGPRVDPQRFIREHDQNGDGALSFEEFRASPAIRNLSEDEQEDRFEVFDKNHDLKISADDIPRPPLPHAVEKPATPPAESK